MTIRHDPNFVSTSFIYVHASHPFTHCIHPMRYIHSCATFSHMLYRIYSSLSMYVLYSFMNLIHPRIHALHSLIRCIAPILLFSCISHIASYPLGQYSPLSRITYTASYGHTSLPISSPYHISSQMFSS